MTGHQPRPAFSCTSGPRPAKMLLVGEAFGESEDTTHRPFVGESGKELFRLLGEAAPDLAPELHAEAVAAQRYGNAWVRGREAWLAAAGIAMTNVLTFRPPGNKIDGLCVTKKELPSGYDLPHLAQGQYLRPEYLPELSRLYFEISSLNPNLIVALGNTACWAVLRATNIGSIRGTISTAAPGLLSHSLAAREALVGNERGRVAGRTDWKVLPTYHPAALLRQWSWRPIVLADLMKGFREAEFPEIRRPSRTVLVSPTLSEVLAWTEATLASPPPLLSCDIETGAGQIKCVGFARSRSESMIVPFVDLGRVGGSYWSSAADEWHAWQACKRLLESGIPILGQNFMYDTQYLTRAGILPKNIAEDTMLLHHSLFPELQKGLGFLGSIYTNESSWKLLRRQRADTEKKDE